MKNANIKVESIPLLCQANKKRRGSLHLESFKKGGYIDAQFRKIGFNPVFNFPIVYCFPLQHNSVGEYCNMSLHPQKELPQRSQYGK